MEGMKILVLNASPKKENSVTLQSSLYLEKKFPEESFDYIDIGVSRKINEERLAEISTSIGNAELIIFSFPVYTFMAPSQLHYFIRMLKEKGLSFTSRAATIITTSKHFYDTTAHRWLKENLLDLGFSFIEGHSMDMEDLLAEKGRKELVSFFRRTLWALENGITECKAEKKEDEYALPDITTEAESTEKSDRYTVTLVIDSTYGKERLLKMTGLFGAIFPYRTKTVDLSSFAFRGGCLGCLRCALEGKCVYRDGFEHLLEDEILSSDAVVYAFTPTDHSMGPVFKNYDDRRFYNGHRTVSQGKSIGYIINGRMAEEDNLREVLEARSDVGRNYLAGMAEDTEGIRKLSKNLSHALETGYTKPQMFYGVGGMKIFRDLIWVMRGIMRDDHRFYRDNGYYDFPQKQRGKMMGLLLAGALMRNRSFMKKNAGMMTKGMLAPYKKVIGEKD